jgi:chromosome segregation ATPase
MSTFNRLRETRSKVLEALLASLFAQQQLQDCIANQGFPDEVHAKLHADVDKLWISSRSLDGRTLDEWTRRSPNSISAPRRGLFALGGALGGAVGGAALATYVQKRSAPPATSTTIPPAPDLLNEELKDMVNALKTAKDTLDAYRQPADKASCNIDIVADLYAEILRLRQRRAVDQAAYDSQAVMLSKALDTVVDIKLKSEEELKTCMARLETKNRDFDDLKKGEPEQARIVEERSAFKAEVQAAQARVDTYQRQEKTHVETLAAFQKRVFDLQQMLSSQQEECKQAEASLTKALDRITKQQLEIGTLTANLASARTDKSRVDQRVAALTEELKKQEGLDAQFEQAQQQAQEEKAASQIREKGYINALAGFQKRVFELQQMLSNRREECKQIDTSFVKALDQITKQQLTADTLRTQLEKCRQELAGCKSTLRAANVVAGQKGAIEAQLAEEKKKEDVFKNKEAEFVNVLAAFQKHVFELQQKLSDRTEECKQTNDSLGRALDRVTELRLKENELERKLSDMIEEKSSCDRKVIRLEGIAREKVQLDEKLKAAGVKQAESEHREGEHINMLAAFQKHVFELQQKLSSQTEECKQTNESLVRALDQVTRQELELVRSRERENRQIDTMAAYHKRVLELQLGLETTRNERTQTYDSLESALDKLAACQLERDALEIRLNQEKADLTSEYMERLNGWLAQQTLYIEALAASQWSLEKLKQDKAIADQGRDMLSKQLEAALDRVVDVELQRQNDEVQNKEQLSTADDILAKEVGGVIDALALSQKDLMELRTKRAHEQAEHQELEQTFMKALDWIALHALQCSTMEATNRQLQAQIQTCNLTLEQQAATLSENQSELERLKAVDNGDVDMPDLPKGDDCDQHIELAALAVAQSMKLHIQNAELSAAHTQTYEELVLALSKLTECELSKEAELRDLRDLRADNFAKQAIIHQCDVAYSELQTKLSTCEATSAQLQKSNTTGQAELTALKISYAGLQAQHQDQSILRASNTKLQTALSYCEIELLKIQNEREVVEAELESTKQTLNRALDKAWQYDLAAKTKTSELMALNQKNFSILQELTKLQESNLTQSNSIAALQGQLKNQADLIANNTELQQKMVRCQNMETECQRLAKENDGLKVQAVGQQTLIDSNTKLQTALSYCEIELLKIQNEREVVEAELDSTKQTLNRALDKAWQYDLQAKTCATSLAACQAANSNIQVVCTTEVNRLQAELEPLRQTITSQQQQISQHQQNASLVAQLQAAAADRDATLAQQQTAVASATATIDKLQTAFSYCEIELLKIQNEREVVEAELDITKQTLNRALDKAWQYDLASKNKDATLRENGAQLAQLQTLQNRVASQDAIIRDGTAQIQTLQNQIRQQQTQMDAQKVNIKLGSYITQKAAAMRNKSGVPTFGDRLQELQKCVDDGKPNCAEWFFDGREQERNKNIKKLYGEMSTMANICAVNRILRPRPEERQGSPGATIAPRREPSDKRRGVLPDAEDPRWAQLPPFRPQM